MTYSDWENTHKIKRNNLQRKLEKQGFTKEQIIDYFDFNNMFKHEPNFCGMYKIKTKCHDTDYLNCYNCGCPYFKYTDNPTPNKEGKKRFSYCTINSKFSKDFEINENIHCDCTDCVIPHTKQSAFNNYEQVSKVNDSSSILEHIRGWQLWDILGKYKIF